MADAVGVIGANIAASTVRAVAPQASAPAAPAPTQSVSIEPVQPISPAIHFDPTAGVVITEYYNNEGKVEAQIPSAASVAYLRSGLTSTGAPRENPDAVPTEFPSAVVA